MSEKTFTMSQFATKEALYEAKCLYLEKRLDLLRDVAVAADQVYDEHSHDLGLKDLGAALAKAKREI